ncbi:fumarylacetoacetate hydrolase family protein [Lacisediminihabitans profunda]|uniref:Fumarylacetoacetate hydrolase family protein n=1 Tax=Lacisediminihabitans profunda TaxID=2594790 RepID=A0A5C8UPP3_9MICO|nr:fumarylacetoacetate hydrolase family protein [Lacisediminihabitans profunda]TXN29466.1 fumarylacetoacetate hydrolase family protein [Lacisediminihabitans profunda]
MYYASYFHRGEPGVAEVRDGLLVPLAELTEISAKTSTDDLANARRLPSDAISLESVTLRPVVPNPRKIICVGLNYLDHVEEAKRDLPAYPVLFAKFASSLIGPDDAIILPPESEQVDYEGELAVVIGRPGRRISEDDALNHVLGYSVANDVTMRDYQYKTHQWLQGKAWDSSTPVGPFIRVASTVDMANAVIRTTLNGRVVQDSDLSHLIFSIPRLIAVISDFTALSPGDIILTGTPGGVGFRRDPQVFLRPGDSITVEIDGVGALTSGVRAEQASL